MNSKMQNGGQSCDKIDGIKCDVQNCVYHKKDNSCEAGNIEVGPGYANSSEETICATFRPGEQQ